MHAHLMKQISTKNMILMEITLDEKTDWFVYHDGFFELRMYNPTVQDYRFKYDSNLLFLRLGYLSV